MRRFYTLLAEKLKYYLWGRALVNHMSRHYRLYENLEALYTALILALLIKAFLFEAYKIPSASMMNTLIEGDRIFVNKFSYNFSNIQAGDIIVFKTKGIDEIYSPDKPYYIKRVVGFPNDRIEIRNGNIFRNGQLMTDPPFFLENYYTDFYGRDTFIVPDGELFVFGDNSRNSSDSRDWGGVPIENVMGKAIFRYWPPSRIGFLHGESVNSTLSRERNTRERYHNGNRANAAER